MAYDDRTPIETLATVILDTFTGTEPTRSAASLTYNAAHGDYYTLLGLERDSTRAEVEGALAKARQHPDAGDPQVAAALDNAESVLLNAGLRARYDASLD